MMDKLDIGLTTLMPLKAEFHDFLNEVKNQPKHFGFHQSEHYAITGSLSPFGIDGQFHGWLRHKRNDGLQTHKVELNDVGQFGMSRVLTDIERIVDLDPKRLPVMRIDLAADIRDVPVSFFHRHMRVALKRRGAHVTQFEHIYQGEGDTIYFGKRPNCYRVYNKIAELKNQHKRMVLRGMAADRREHKLNLVNRHRDETLPEFQPTQWPTFAESFCYSEHDCLTRVERQIGGKMIPMQINRLGKLEQLPEFNPYDMVQMFAGKNELPKPYAGDFNFPQYHCGLFLQGMQEQYGIDYVRNYIRNWVGKQNATAVFELYEPFFRFVAGTEGVTQDELYESYKQSVMRQIAA